METMEPIEALTRARREFESRLRQVGDDQWDLPTPCTEWSVRELVNHVMLGNRMAVQLLAGATKDDVMAGFGDDLVAASDDVVADFAALADRLHQGFAAEGGLDGTVDHPMGQIPRAMFVGFRIGDYGVHAWDLARAIGADETLDPALVDRIYADFEPMAAGLGQSGMFGTGPSGSADAAASRQAAMLDMTGRRP